MYELIIFGMVTFFAAIINSPCIGQIGNVWQFPSFTAQSLTLPTWSNPLQGEGDILIDNFEYWDSPYNHGWKQIEPAFPVFGFGLGYAVIFKTVLDLQNGSRVLDVYRPASIFLLGTRYERHGIYYNLVTPPGPGSAAASGIDLSKNPIMSFKYSAPLGIETWDLFEFSVIAETSAGYSVTIHIMPVDPPGVGFRPGVAKGLEIKNVTGGSNPSMDINVYIGRCFVGGLGWAIVWLNLPDTVNDALAEYTGSLPVGTPADWEIVSALRVVASGQMFRLDDIMFRAHDVTKLFDPYLFKIGPRYAQIFEPYRYLFFADYDTGDKPISKVSDFLLTGNFVDLFITDPNEIADIWVTEYGADPNRFGEEPDPNVSDLMGRDFVVDTQLPLFADANLRLGNNPYLAFIPNTKINQTLNWNATVGGFGAEGVQFQDVTPLEINPYDGMPTYIPVYYDAQAFIDAFGKSFINPHAAFFLESALYNAGLVFWPNIAELDFTPQVFEDIIMTLEVTNERTSDVETFPISVVNYPVENHPPFIEDVDDQIFYVGKSNTYAVGVIDADCTIFSLSGSPPTSHKPANWGEFRTDMDNIYWRFMLNGLPSYQYGPWIQDMINPSSGVIGFTPKFEGVYEAVLSATDDRGASGLAQFTMFCVNQGTWLNHPPVILKDWEHPIVVRAGEEIILTEPMISVVDPDGDELYCSSTIGACGCTGDGKFMWTFQPNFPGNYTTEIVAFDIRGGYAIVRLDIVVKPWWSY